MRGARDVGVTRRGVGHRRATSSAVVAGGFVALAALSGCASVDGSGTAAPGEVAVYRSEVSASEASVARENGIDLCREAMSSMVVMVRGYNAFVRRLSDVHSYDEIGDLDDKARASLIAGSDLIRQKITSSTPADVKDPADRFLDSTGRLGDAIGKERLTGLNPIAAQWTRDKQAVLDSCTDYLPMPPTANASPAPAPGAGPSESATSTAPTPSVPATP